MAEDNVAEVGLEMECEVFEEEDEEDDSSSCTSEDSARDSDEEDQGEIGEFADDEHSDHHADNPVGVVLPYQHEPAPHPRNEGEVENNGDLPREVDQARLFDTDPW